MLDEMFPKLEDSRKAELLRFGRAGALVDSEMADGIGRARIQTAAAGFADTNLLGNPFVGLDQRFGQDAGQINSRAEFRRQDIHFEPERAEPCFDSQMARTQPPVTGVLVRPVSLLGGGDKRRIALILQPFRQFVSDLVHIPEYQHIHVLDRDIRFGPESPCRDTLGNDNHAFCIG